ncbi:MAG: hypothetical protein WC717_02010 [Candidatus Micrarchaeia archaeon]|jgi:hypothetical protein
MAGQLAEKTRYSSTSQAKQGLDLENIVPRHRANLHSIPRKSQGQGEEKKPDGRTAPRNNEKFLQFDVFSEQTANSVRFRYSIVAPEKDYKTWRYHANTPKSEHILSIYLYVDGELLYSGTAKQPANPKEYKVHFEGMIGPFPRLEGEHTYRFEAMVTEDVVGNYLFRTAPSVKALREGLADFGITPGLDESSAKKVQRLLDTKDTDVNSARKKITIGGKEYEIRITNEHGYRLEVFLPENSKDKEAAKLASKLASQTKTVIDCWEAKEFAIGPDAKVDEAAPLATQAVETEKPAATLEEKGTASAGAGTTIIAPPLHAQHTDAASWKVVSSRYFFSKDPAHRRLLVLQKGSEVKEYYLNTALLGQLTADKKNIIFRFTPGARISEDELQGILKLFAPGKPGVPLLEPFVPKGNEKHK